MKHVIAVLGIVIAALCAIGLRVVLEGREALATGDAAMSARRTTDAVAAWESAARWYLPGAPHVDAAYARLVELAGSDPKHAVVAWRAVRRAALATRSLWTPHADDLAAADAALARLAALAPGGAAAAGPSPAERQAWQAARLAEAARPSPIAVALAIFGIAGWLAGIFTVVAHGLDHAGRLVRRPAATGAALTVIGLVAWAAGLYNA